MNRRDLLKSIGIGILTSFLPIHYKSKPKKNTFSEELFLTDNGTWTNPHTYIGIKSNEPKVGNMSVNMDTNVISVYNGSEWLTLGD